MPDPTIINIEDLRGGWNASDPATIENNQLALAENWYYDDQQIMTTRKGTANFGNSIAGVDNIHSLYFAKFTDGTRHLLCGATTATGTSVYKYNETTSDWDFLIGTLAADVRLSFATFKDEIYWTNGTDYVMSYDGTSVSAHVSVEKGRYLIVVNDVAYMCNINNDPSTVFYTNSNPIDLKSSFPNYVVIEEDNGQTITGAQYQGGLLLVGKEKSIYSYDVVGDTVDILDYSGGVASHRSWQRVDNDTLYLSRAGVFSLIQRKGTVGSLRSTPLTNNLQKIIKGVGDPEIACAFYSERNRNYYLALDQDGAGKNKGLLVRNTIVGQYKPDAGWTNYVGMNFNDIVEYEDEDGEYHILGANVFGGQCIEMETGYDDLGNEIRCKLHFKQFDFGEATRHKTFPFVDFQGLSSAGVNGASFILDIDGRSKTKTFNASTYIDVPAGAKALGKYPLGMYPVGAGPTDGGIPTEDFDIRVNAGYDSGRRIQPKIEVDILNAKLQIRKISPAVITHPVDVFPTNNII